MHGPTAWSQLSPANVFMRLAESPGNAASWTRNCCCELRRGGHGTPTCDGRVWAASPLPALARLGLCRLLGLRWQRTLNSYAGQVRLRVDEFPELPKLCTKLVVCLDRGSNIVHVRQRFILPAGDGSGSRKPRPSFSGRVPSGRLRGRAAKNGWSNAAFQLRTEHRSHP